MSKETGGSAFPTHLNLTQGMTMRDYFAAEAMHAVFPKLIDALQSDDIVPDVKIIQAKTLAAVSCYAIADAMLKAREA